MDIENESELLITQPARSRRTSTLLLLVEVAAISQLLLSAGNFICGLLTLVYIKPAIYRNWLWGPFTIGTLMFVGAVVGLIISGKYFKRHSATWQTTRCLVKIHIIVSFVTFFVCMTVIMSTFVKDEKNNREVYISAIVVSSFTSLYCLLSVCIDCVFGQTSEIHLHGKRTERKRTTSIRRPTLVRILNAVPTVRDRFESTLSDNSSQILTPSHSNDMLASFNSLDSYGALADPTSAGACGTIADCVNMGNSGTMGNCEVMPVPDRSLIVKQSQKHCSVNSRYTNKALQSNSYYPAYNNDLEDTNTCTTKASIHTKADT